MVMGGHLETWGAGLPDNEDATFNEDLFRVQGYLHAAEAASLHGCNLLEHRRASLKLV